MCLTTVQQGKQAKKNIRALNKLPVLIGYKVFTISPKKTVHWEFNNHHKKVPVNKWLTAQRTRISLGGWWSYTSGYHVFATPQGARQWANRRQLVVGVYADNITAIGNQGTHLVYIAQNIWVDKNDIIQLPYTLKAKDLKW